ncbi:hypothetical protein CPB84DRAFT_1746574 [Gymnopilus junonius]|uniref:Protein-S-isoprenylcysteine O-methyltransferase n=1 Tax=Gymnopilus junonius TaxID=109634 RepID=A0A9P5NSR8_GYMJU|nr:hypothetical protein CPB84DRAFT_1746574 [Gymnopilus junonius]
MSLTKIPLTFAVCWAFTKTITPPNPPPSQGDKAVRSNFMEMKWYTSRSPYYAGGFNGSQASQKQLRLSPIITRPLPWNPNALRLSTATTIGGCMMVTGALLRLATYRYLGKFFKFEASIQRDHKLVTGGPYSIVRHPSYTGLLLTHPGWFLWQFGDGSWLRESGRVFVGFYAVLMIIGTLYLTLGRMHKEDAALRKHFGKQWDDWASKVQYRVIPGIW